jgi:hypothetical protein
VIELCIPPSRVRRASVTDHALVLLALTWISLNRPGKSVKEASANIWSRQDFAELGQRGLQPPVDIIDNDHADSNGRNRVPVRLITRRSSAKPSHGRSGTERHRGASWNFLASILWIGS